MGLEKHQGKHHFLQYHICYLGFLMNSSRFNSFRSPGPPVLTSLLSHIFFQLMAPGFAKSNTLRYPLQPRLHFTLFPPNYFSHCLSSASLWSLNIRHLDKLNVEPFMPANSITGASKFCCQVEL